jgi:iron complex outermembrane receptor protein
MDRWISGYIQDDISLIDDRLRLTIGTKLEQNNFTGFEIQPSAKLFFRPSPEFAIWGGVSRAVRTPSRFERNSDLNLIVELPNSANNPLPLPVFNHIAGNPDALSERLIAYEAGLRWQISPNWSADIAAYVNDYDRLASLDFAGASPIFVSPIPFPVALQSESIFANSSKATTWGVEFLLRGRVTPWWKTEIVYSHFDFDLADDLINGQPLRLLWDLNGSAKNTASITNDMDFGDRVSLRTQVRYVSELFDGLVPDYVSVDARLNYRITDGIDFSIIGENLFSERRVEFIQPSYETRTAFVPRSVAAQARFRF